MVLSSLILVACDTLDGVRMDVRPKFQSDWSCVTRNLDKVGYQYNIDNSNQLSVSKEGRYLFFVNSTESSMMQMYFYVMGGTLPCSVADESYSEMRKFMVEVEHSCGYKAQEYSVSLECSSEK